MSNLMKDYLALLQENEDKVRREARRLIYKICKNILMNPLQPKYRKILLSNETVSKKLLPATGAIQILFAIGFQEDDDGFLLPIRSSLLRVKELYDLMNATPESPPKPKPVVIQPPNVQMPSTSGILPLVLQKIPKKTSSREKQFFITLADHFKDALRYEDDYLQDKARAVLPLQMLQIQALKKMRIIQKELKLKNLELSVDFHDLLLNEMMIWFKEKFFTWVDSPQCDRCSGECVYNRTVKSYHRKISRIEIHKCIVCGDENQFPRYSDPECLLFTKKGRCGEWANCFTLFCRVAKFDARLIFDETDHVWTEVWSDFHQKWHHVDPCEGVLDAELMYEKGWGKQLSYVIAFSRDEIVDVTWRYTRNYTEVMKRRNICSEESLRLFINKMNELRHAEPNYSTARKKFVRLRAAKELVGMMPAPPGCTKPSEEAEKNLNYNSRQSGSIAWKIARGEVGDSHTSDASFQWTIPKDVKHYELSYSIIPDNYSAKDVEKDKVLLEKEKWRSGVHAVEGGMFRKEERDWKMVYLARLPTNPTSKVTWTFVVEDKDLARIDSVKLRANWTTFHGATVEWKITGITHFPDKNETRDLPIPNSENFETRDLTGATQIEISATLSGGMGEQSWQHAQLFRESMTTPSEGPSMVVEIKLIEKV